MENTSTRLVFILSKKLPSSPQKKDMKGCGSRTHALIFVGDKVISSQQLKPFDHGGGPAFSGILHSSSSGKFQESS